jgi:C4-dicarboxylate transporter/malic acid transport protein
MTSGTDAATPSRLRTWHPGWMGVVLGTAGVAVASLVDPLPALRVDEAVGAALAAIAVILLPVLLVPYWRRTRSHRDAAGADLAHPGLGALYGTVPASLLVTGLALAQLAVIGWLPAWTAWIVLALMVVGLVGAVALGVAFFSGVIGREQVPSEAMTGAWFIPIVVLVLVPSVVVRLVALQPEWRSTSWVALAAASVGAGFLLFLILAPVIAWRLVTAPPPPAHQAATWWIWLAPAGAGGLGMLATSRVAGAAAGGPAAEVLPWMGLVIATGIWGLGVWWAVFAGRVLVRTSREAGGLPFHVGSWGFAFPTGAMTALTVELGRTWDAPVIEVAGAVGFVVAVIVWLRLAAQTTAAVRSGKAFAR